FAAPATPRALHSFPTRRSSDLGVGGTKDGPTPKPAPATPGRGEPPKEERSPEPRATAKATDEDVADRVVAVVNNDAITLGELQRSEEHTSELQSRFDLVCRLLI